MFFVANIIKCIDPKITDEISTNSFPKLDL